VVQIHSPRSLIILESSTCSHFQIWLGFDFRSIRSNNDIFGRKLEAQTNSFSNFFAELNVWLANCYFAHDSSGFRLLIPFFDAPSGLP
jgi:hypothetical protein